MKGAFKQVIAISQASTTNGGTASGSIDTLGFDWATIDVIASTSDNVTNNPSVFKLSEGDTTAYSSSTNITAFVGDGAGGFTIPNSVTSGNWGVKMNVDCRARKRYLFVAVSPVTTQLVTAIANLYSGDTWAANTTDAGVKALVQG